MVVGCKYRDNVRPWSTTTDWSVSSGLNTKGLVMTNAAVMAFEQLGGELVILAVAAGVLACCALLCCMLGGCAGLPQEGLLCVQRSRADCCGRCGLAARRCAAAAAARAVTAILDLAAAGLAAAIHVPQKPTSPPWKTSYRSTAR